MNDDYDNDGSGRCPNAKCEGWVDGGVCGTCGDDFHAEVRFEELREMTLTLGIMIERESVPLAAQMFVRDPRFKRLTAPLQPTERGTE